MDEIILKKRRDMKIYTRFARNYEIYVHMY